MPVKVDLKTVMVSMIQHPDTFPTVSAALDKDATKYFSGHFKDKGMGIERLRASHDALGEDDLALILESLDDRAVAALLKKVDPHRGAGDSPSDLEHLKAIAGGRAAPHPRPDRPTRASASRPKPPLTRAGADKAASAKGSGTRRTATGSEVGAPAKRSRNPKKPTPDAD